MWGLFSPSFVFSHSHWKLRISDSVALRIHKSIPAPHPPFLIWVKTRASLKGSEKGGGVGESSEFETDDVAGRNPAAFFWPQGVFSHFLMPVWTFDHENAVVRGDNLWSYLDLPYISFYVFHVSSFLPSLLRSSQTFPKQIASQISATPVSFDISFRISQRVTRFTLCFSIWNACQQSCLVLKRGKKTPDRRLKD